MKLRNIPAILALSVLGACAGSRTTMPDDEILECPANEYLVCRGGTISRIGNSNQRDPRFCTCQPRDGINLQPTSLVSPALTRQLKKTTGK